LTDAAKDAANSASDEEDPEFWDEFSSDPAEAAKKAAACTDNIDRYRAGKIMGRLSAKFFGQELKANV